MPSSKGSLLTTSDMVDVTVTPSRSALYVVLGIGVTLTGGLFVLARQSGWTRGWIYMGRFISQRLVNLVCAGVAMGVGLGLTVYKPMGEERGKSVPLGGFTLAERSG